MYLVTTTKLGRSVSILAVSAILLFVPIACTGCWAPMRSHGIPARALSDEFRMPLRTAGPPLNYSNLTIEPPNDYLLGPGDLLEITIPDLYPRAEVAPLRVQVMSNGEVHLPLVGAVRVAGTNLLQAQVAITRTYADGYLRDPRVNVVLAQKETVSVLVLGQVNQPGVHILPKYENDVGHALAAAGGLAEDAADMIEVHRRFPQKQNPHAPLRSLPPVFDLGDSFSGNPTSVLVGKDEEPNILRIPLRGPGASFPLERDDIVLQAGDVVIVPSRKHEVFYVVGRLSQTNTVRFTIGNRERELGVGFVLPRDREIDVVTAVAMAGYIDPIESPTTVTVHRTMPDGSPMLIHVDLIKARYDQMENVNVWPGDIIYLNPDTKWWFRYTFDRIVSQIFLLPYARWAGP